ncbi:MAG: Rpn family recombination-promoting nuclease/putative transposase [Treponema sp.]|nr:Rpn family recombination-promoting nuclease/putative transposase [Spirochaetia bacterium]MDD7460712.1 Rpn family recombination-promoting nuclease/putative transposase [Spirochaetales bacterium]MDY5812284.1 Rpn family recombination-promoting nuclease/putative transposase [Treponema sp.]
MNGLKPVEELELTDDYMFMAVMRDEEICRELLERLLKIQIEKVEYPELQKEIRPYYESKGVRLDVYVKDSDHIYDIEIQTYHDKNLAKRTRVYQSMIDADNLMRGQDYIELKESFVIFITTFDPFGYEMPVYTFKNICKENKEIILQDETSKIFFNATAYKKESDIAIRRFMGYLLNKEPTDDFTRKLDNLVNSIKSNKQFRKGYDNMGAVWYMDAKREGIALGREQGISIGKQQGILQKSLDAAKKLLVRGLSAEEISQIVELPVSQVEQLSRQAD